MQASTVRDLAHNPLKRFLYSGVLATLNSDDPAVRYRVSILVMSIARLRRPEQGRYCYAQQNGLTIVFLSEAEKQALREKVLSRQR